MIEDLFRQPTMYLARHGETDLNDEGRFRGWEDVPLTDEGMAAAQEVAHFLCYREIGQVASSDLVRAVQTASALASGFDRNPNLRPWNIGDFAGKSKQEFGPKLQRYVDNPELVPPGGESLSQFRARVDETIEAYLAQAQYQAPPVLVTHTSVITAVRDLLTPSNPSDGDIVEPGGIVAIYLKSDGEPDIVPVLGAVIREATPNAS